MEHPSYGESYDSENSSMSNSLSQNSTRKPSESIILREYPFRNLFQLNDSSWTPFVKAEKETTVASQRPIELVPCDLQDPPKYEETKNSYQSSRFPDNPASELKQSTRRLLLLVEELQLRTHKNISNLENRSNEKSILILNPYESEDDDCSTYKRLIRKCHCLNREEYNDFVIHFNEDTKNYTNTIGEIIKNVRIVKKFLYMGGKYTKNALIFLNEALSESSFTEKVEILEGIAHADVCNIFEDYSIVSSCISWPCKFENLKDTGVQSLTADLLYKLSQLEEGRRYLKFNSKVTHEIKKVLRKKSCKLETDTIEVLHKAIDLLHPPIDVSSNFTYYCHSVREGYGRKILNILIHYKDYMTPDEVLTHLDLLYNLSTKDNGKLELVKLLPDILHLMKSLLIKYNNSQMNVVITNILSNLAPMIKDDDCYLTTTVSTGVCTEPLRAISESIQISSKNINSKKINKSKLILTNKFRQPSKTNKAESRKPFIIVPIEK